VVPFDVQAGSLSYDVSCGARQCQDSAGCAQSGTASLANADDAEVVSHMEILEGQNRGQNRWHGFEHAVRGIGSWPPDDLDVCSIPQFIEEELVQSLLGSTINRVEHRAEQNGEQNLGIFAENFTVENGFVIPEPSMDDQTLVGSDTYQSM
jgi:hypothetical protein